ncbi:MAG: hypothetical protein E7620_00565 [Ruminococcaceae bacterium]|nr:hypothetical protein [Oscillospiraceae bacterium]
MIAIYKRELRSCFHSLLGWLTVGISLLASGVLTAVLNLLAGSTDFSYILRVALSMSTLSIPVVSVASVMTFTRENKHGNGGWLSSLPVSLWQLRLGKYLAALTLISIPTAVLALYPLILENFGTLSYGSAYTALFGYWLLTAALLAICSLVASRFRNWIVSLAVCLAIGVGLLFVLPLLSAICGTLPLIGMLIGVVACAAVCAVRMLRRRRFLPITLFVCAGVALAQVALYLLLPDFFRRFLSALLAELSLFERLNGFCAGQFDLPATVLLLSVCALCLFMLAVRWEGSAKKRASKRALLLAGALIALNVATAFAPYRLSYPNVSGNGVFRISDASARYLSTVDRKVEILYHVKGGRRAADRDIYSFLLQYESKNPLIEVKLVDISKEDTSAADQSITVRSETGSRSFMVTELYYYYSNAMKMPLTLEEYAAVLSSYSSSSLTQDAYQTLMSYYGPAVMQVYYAGDANLTGAIRYVLTENTPTVGVYSNGIVTVNQLLRHELEQQGYGMTAVSSLADFTGDALILQLSKDLTAEEATALSSYLSRGGKVLLTTSFTTTFETPNLLGALAPFGLSCHQEMNVVYDVSENSYSPIFSASLGDHPITDGLSGYVGYNAHAILSTETDGVTHSILLRSSESSVLLTKETQNQQEPDAESYALGVLAEKGDAAVLWLGMTMESISNAYSGGGNYSFVAAALEQFTGFSGISMRISHKAVPSDYLGATMGNLIFWILTFVLIIPVGVIVAGGIKFYFRRKRR